jgi:hypothetical protein
VRELEALVAELEVWNAEKQRYERREIASGRFVYALRPAEQGTEPPQMICLDCYGQGRKSILRRDRRRSASGGFFRKRRSIDMVGALGCRI